MKIVIINGSATTGKDTFVEAIENKFKNVYNISTIDPINHMLHEMGWDGTKDEQYRQLASDLKDFGSKYDFSFNYVVNYTSRKQYKNGFSSSNVVVFIHCREPEQIKQFVNYYSDSRYFCTTLLIKRDGTKKFENHADKNVDKYNYDDIILNNGTISELEKKALAYYNNIMRSN